MTYPSPFILHNSQFRQYKLRKKDKWYIIRKKIRSPEHLLGYIEKMQPTDVYQTVSWWLNPNSLSGKRANLPEYNGRNKKEIKKAKIEHFLNSIFLGSDYIMDFDDKDYSNGSEGSQSQLKLSKLKLNEIGLKDFLTMRTGKGYQLLVMDFNAWAKKDMKAVMPRDREFQYQRKMEELTKKLLEAKITWDYKVSTDTRRIFRVPNTLHNNGNIIKVL
jgi:hypothetical protein